MRKILTEEEKWRDLVGGFILAFGEIELFTYHLWSEYCPSKKAPNLFKPRASALLVAMEQSASAPPGTIEALRDAIKLAKKRNVVAHNPTMVEVYERSQTGQLVLQKGIFSKTSKEFIDDSELTELLAAVEEIVSKLYRGHGQPRS